MPVTEHGETSPIAREIDVPGLPLRVVRQPKGFDGRKELSVHFLEHFPHDRRIDAANEAAVAGDEVVITSEGKPRAWLNPIPQPGGPRVPGFAKGAFLAMSPDFDAPLPDEFWLGDNP